jgi:hypothetical protein
MLLARAGQSGKFAPNPTEFECFSYAARNFWRHFFKSKLRDFLKVDNKKILGGACAVHSPFSG